MNAQLPLSVEDLVLVLTRQPTRSEAPRLGMLERHGVGDSDEIPCYVCQESEAFLECEQHRGEVAQEIARLVTAEARSVYVVVHKKDSRFVFAQLGLVDELLKLLPGCVRILTIGDDKGVIAGEIRRVIAEERTQHNGETDEVSPLLDVFEEIGLIKYKKLVESIASHDEADDDSANSAHG